jgi:tetratricopeptide (TPR) repeat protein
VLCAVCLLGLAGGAAAQRRGAADGLDALDARMEPLLSRVEQEEARSGSFARELIEPLTALGLAYQEHGEHALAVAALDRAYYLHRFNEGLHDLEQVPLVRRLIESERALGRFARAAELEERLLEIARRNRSDLRSVPIFREAAERQLALHERGEHGEGPVALGIGGFGSAPMFGLWRARRLYEEAIATIVANRAYGHPELAELEDALTRTYYFEARGQQAASLDPSDRATAWRASLYDLGRDSYRRRVAYSASGSSAYEVARALVELADWSIVFSRNGTALKDYARALALLVESGASEAAIEELFPTDVPVFLPTFVPSPLEALADGQATGYVDFDFEIGRYGQPRRTRIVALQGAAAAASARAVAAAIARSRFRPSPFAETERATNYRLRYSLADGSLTPRD